MEKIHIKDALSTSHVNTGVESGYIL